MYARLLARSRLPNLRWAFACVAAIVFALGCRAGADDQGGDGPEGGGEEAVAAVPVEVATVERADLRASVAGSTTLQSVTRVSVVSEVAGTLTALDVDEGDVVVEGDRIAVVDNEDAALAIREARQSVTRFERELAALRPLFDDGYLSRQAFEEVEFQLETARTTLARAQRSSANQTVRAPMSGAVTARMAEVGEVVVPNQALIEIARVDALEATIRVPERALADVRVGQVVEIAIRALDEALVSGRVDRIHPTVDPQTGTVAVRIRLDDIQTDAGVTLRPGMFVTARIVTDVREGVAAVPRRALVYEGDATRVFVVREEDPPDGSGEAAEGSAEGSGDAGPWLVARRVTLTTGYDDADRIEAVEGVEVGDRVVIAGQAGLDDGDRVTIPVDAPSDEGEPDEGSADAPDDSGDR